MSWHLQVSLQKSQIASTTTSVCERSSNCFINSYKSEKRTTMAPRKSATPQPSTPKPSTTTASTTPSKPPSRPSSSSSVRSTQDAQQIVIGVWNNYVDKTPQRVKLLDAFMVFLMTVGSIQFVYCVVAGNYVCDADTIHLYNQVLRTVMLTIEQPFNAFLSGFSACVGQFVLTASLRMQTNTENKAEFEQISHER
jgi:oligosaccharyltransferase complex subunit epsilon